MYLEKFKNDWVNVAMQRLGLTSNIDRDELEKIFDQAYRNTSIGIYNTFTHERSKIPSLSFWYNMPEDVIFNENGVLMWRTCKKESLVKVIISQKIALRQVFKKLKNKCDSEGDKIGFDKYKTLEALCKLMINGFYGLSGYVAGAFFELSCADTTTCGARNIIAVASLTNELLGSGFRNYTISAHMKIIEAAVHDYPAIKGKYTLPEVTVDQVARHMLGEHYDGYYALTVLKQRLGVLDKEVLSFLYIKNNFTEFCKIPEVAEVLKKALKGLTTSNGIDTDETTGVRFINPYKHKPVKDEVRQLEEMIKELAFGFHYYEGDYVNRVYQPTMVDIVSNMKRRKIGAMDTDSNVTVLQQEKEFLLDYFSDVIGDKVNDDEFTECSLVLFITTLYLACIKRGLLEYTVSIGIDKALSEQYVDLECEMVMRNLQLTVNKKNYIFQTMEKDYIMKNSTGVRGLKFIKSDSNSSMSEMVESDVFGKILVDQDKIDYADIIMSIHSNTASVIDMLRTPEFITEKKTVLKIADTTDLRFGDPRYKACRLWDKLYPEQKIELPGSFGMIKLKITKEILGDLEMKFPKVFKIMYNHAEETFKFKKVNSLFGKLDKIYDDDNPKHWEVMKTIKTGSPKAKQVLRQICKLVYNKYQKDKFHEGLYEKIVNIIQSAGLDKNEFNFIKKLTGFGVEFNPARHIPSNIDRLALPIDINEVPSFISYNNFNILDIEIASEYEMLLSPLINTLSITSPKTKTKKAVITSMLQTF